MFVAPRIQYIIQYPDYNWDWKYISQHYVIPFHILLSNYDLPWNMWGISRNPCITLDIIRKYPDLSWSFRGISWNPNLTKEFFLDNLGMSWDWRRICSLPFMDIELIDEINKNKSDIIELDWMSLSKNPNITLDSIIQNPQYKWTWEQISLREDLTWSIIYKNLDKPWDWSHISENKIITMDIVKMYPNLPWSWITLSFNPNITIYDVLDNLEKPWSWWNLAYKKHPLEILQMDLPWDWRALSNFGHLNKEILKINAPWDWESISYNPNIPIQDLIETMNNNNTINIINVWHLSRRYDLEIKCVLDNLIPWDWDGISANPAITMRDVRENINEPWNWESLSKNPNLDIDFIYMYSDKPWNIRELSRNPFLGNYKRQIASWGQKIIRKQQCKTIDKILKKYPCNQAIKWIMYTYVIQ
uniref:Uncharacterized protein n=1 Tax=Megaviridae environmental sample TaxID=1737588 RepID=A0A5J6VHH5_9VIRU|nr:MAG: hypothetical protein [Megaviridae environmental sample]